MNVRPILDLILRAEAGPAGYNAVWNGIPKHERPKKPVTTMTLGEVMAWQDAIVSRGYPSSAIGGYQFIRKTLRDLVAKSAKVSPATVFSEQAQDMLATDLLVEKGIHSFLSGGMTDADFAHKLATVWAGLPSPLRGGRSVYGGDGLNSATVGLSDVFDALRDAKGPEVLRPSEPEPFNFDYDVKSLWPVLAGIAAFVLLRGKKGAIVLIAAAIVAALYFGVTQ